VHLLQRLWHERECLQPQSLENEKGSWAAFHSFGASRPVKDRSRGGGRNGLISSETKGRKKEKVFFFLAGFRFIASELHPTSHF